MGNLWGILEKVPHLSIPLYIGISDDLWGMGEIMNGLPLTLMKNLREMKLHSFGVLTKHDL